MDAEIQKKLREKFETTQIGLKPKITCKACSDSRGKACDKHQKAVCNSLRGGPGCGQWITPQHMHIEFVGHANVTDRLLSVDPEWTWEPVAYAPDGLPALTKDGGLWIRLTVAGVTRIGYGGSDGKTGDDAVKEAVSDAIKTTAMRFGVALDLWRKEEASGKPSEEAAPAAESRPNGRQRPAQGQQNGHQRDTRPRAEQPADEPVPSDEGQQDAMKDLLAFVDGRSWERGAVAKRYTDQYKEPIQQASAVRLRAFLTLAQGWPADALPAVAANGAAQ